MTEVGKGDDALATDPEHLLEDAIGVLHGLQRLGHDHHVEAVAGEVGQAAVEILLDDVDVLEQAFGDLVRVDLQAVAGDLLVIAQPGEQLAGAATEVEDSAAGGDPFLNDVQIGAHGSYTSMRVM